MGDETPNPTEISALETAIAKSKEELLNASTSASETDVTNTAKELAKAQVQNDELQAKFNKMEEQMKALQEKDVKVVEPVETPEDKLKKQLADLQEQIDSVKTRKSVPNTPESKDTRTDLEKGQDLYKKDPNQFLKDHLNELGMNLP